MNELRLKGVADEDLPLPDGKAGSGVGEACTRCREGVVPDSRHIGGLNSELSILCIAGRRYLTIPPGS